MRVVKQACLFIYIVIQSLGDDRLKGVLSPAVGPFMAEKSSFWQTILHHVRSGHLRATGIEMMVAALMMLVSGLLLMGANVSDLRRINLSVQNAHLFIQLTDNIDGSLANLELAARGYIITGDDFFRKRFRLRSYELQQALPLLSRGEEPQGALLQQVALLQKLVPQRQKRLAVLFDLPPEKLQPVPGWVANRETWNERQVVTGALSMIRDSEMARIHQLQLDSERKVRQVYFLSTIFSVLSCLLSLLGLFLTGYVHPRQRRG